MVLWCLDLLFRGRALLNFLRIQVYWCFADHPRHLLLLHCKIPRPGSAIATNLVAWLLLVLATSWKLRSLLDLMCRPLYPSIDPQKEMLIETLHTRYSTPLCRVRALFQYTNSLGWHPRYDKIGAHILVVAPRHRLWSICLGVCEDSLIHHISPLVGALASQIVSTSCTYSFANLWRFLHGYPTITPVSPTIPIWVHQIAGTLVLHSQASLGVHLLLWACHTLETHGPKL